ncbi:hypothetical protein QBC47DRAFT_381397 [Echria macrotheca]|uniref:Uncharacterized protein n=1 Tax=Echria macrotheca TaxID=438768 RepID=A0AAJ0BCM8_9PEZI|nr:hypothetical protein QBC47DRAFT_381397 [Echria macrotheca]
MRTCHLVWVFLPDLTPAWWTFSNHHSPPRVFPEQPMVSGARRRLIAMQGQQNIIARVPRIEDHMASIRRVLTRLRLSG